jgi:hypothetical protein
MKKEKTLKCIWCKGIIIPTFTDVLAKFIECEHCGKINYIDWELKIRKAEKLL